MNWGAEDFLAAGCLIGSVAGAFMLARRWWSSPAYLAGLALALGAGFVTVWVTLAVGIIGSEGNPANLIYGAVILVGVSGAAFARLQARGMSWAMLAAAGVQAAACVLAGVASAAQGAGFAAVVSFNVALLLAYLISAGLFRLQARRAGFA